MAYVLDKSDARQPAGAGDCLGTRAAAGAAAAAIPCFCRAPGADPLHLAANRRFGGGTHSPCSGDATPWVALLRPGTPCSVNWTRPSVHWLTCAMHSPFAVILRASNGELGLGYRNCYRGCYSSLVHLHTGATAPGLCWRVGRRSSLARRWQRLGAAGKRRRGGRRCRRARGGLSACSRSSGGRPAKVHAQQTR